MENRRTPISLAIALCIVLLSCSFQTRLIFARQVFGRHVARRPFQKSYALNVAKRRGFSYESSPSSLARVCRGGALEDGEEDEEDEQYDNEEQEQEEEETDLTTSEESPTAISSMLKTLTSISKAIVRAFNAAIQGVESDDGEELSLMEKVVKTIQKMVSAVFNPDEGDTEISISATKSGTKIVEPVPGSDFGSYLSGAYGVTDGRKDVSKFIILGGPLSDALKVARSSARLLVVLIPAAAPSKKIKADKEAIASFLSQDVAKTAKKKALKKGETSSFVLWSAKPGSYEATQAMKRLKVKATSTRGDKRPILAVVYAAQGISPSGVPKIAPKLLAQQHCSPPPSPEAMASWMKLLKKRHAKQYAKMQKDLQEAQYYQERQDGYKESVQSDVERKIRQQKEEEERLAKEKAEKERLEALEKRRTEFLESLPEEPGPKVRDAITLSVRHPDGRSEKRKFASDTKLQDLFNWVDAKFQMEREVVILTTMNGKQTFSWEDATTPEEKTLKEAKLGRMVGFRLSEKKVEEEEKGEDKAEAKEEEATKAEA